MVIAAFGQPSVERVIGEPFAPKTLNGHPAVERSDGTEDACRKQWEIDKRLQTDLARVLLFERVEHVPIPDIHPVREVQAEQQDDSETSGVRPGAPIASATPESARRLPEAAHQPPLRALIDSDRLSGRLLHEMLSRCGRCKSGAMVHDCSRSNADPNVEFRRGKWLGALRIRA